MIDVHSHLLPFVDDGSKSNEISLGMLKEMELDGITDVILTPHKNLRYGKEREELLKEFEKFKNVAKEFPVNLYLGQEIYVSKDVFSLLDEGKLLSLNQSKYLLLEFDYFEKQDITETVYRAVRRGFIPIVAHVERYEYLKAEEVVEVVQLGGLIQVNASSILKKNDRRIKKLIKFLLKENLVHFIASDYHSFRTLEMAKAKKLIEKKFGVDRANDLFINNAKKIIEG